MSRTTKVGLWLVPWLPLFALTASLHAHFTSPKYYVTSKLVLHRHADGTTSSEILSHSPSGEFQLTWIGALGWLCIAAFAAGIVLFAISGLRKLSRQNTLSV
jgi:hypothetical protein